MRPALRIEPSLIGIVPLLGGGATPNRSDGVGTAAADSTHSAADVGEPPALGEPIGGASIVAVRWLVVEEGEAAEVSGEGSSGGRLHFIYENAIERASNGG